jgi:malonyl-CoA/methylmalonyl-CoA synthetase
MNLAEILKLKFKKYSEKEAVIFEGRRLTYCQLEKITSGIAGLLDKIGIKKGDRVAVQLSKCPEIACFHIGCLAAGAVVIHINDAYKQDEVAYLLKDSGAALFITDYPNYIKSKEALHQAANLQIMTIDNRIEDLLFYPEELDRVDISTPVFAAGDDDPAVILYTSGTTGESKGAVISHRALIANMEDLHNLWRLSSRDISLHTLHLLHGHGLLLAFQGALYAGATTIMHKNFDPEQVWKTIADKQCTLFMGVPTMYQRLLDRWKEMAQKPDICSMRLFTCGSAPLSKDLFYGFRDTTGYTILERYGLTETLVIASNPYESGSRKPGSVGFPLQRIAVRIVGSKNRAVNPGETGEICVKGDYLFNGYWHDPEKTEESFTGGWFRSGDLGYQDPDDNCRLFLVGRAGDMIISGGYNVYPKEVETRLERHNGVMETAVIPSPDRDLGEMVVAAVVKKTGSEVDEHDLKEFCKKDLAGYKCPKKIIFLSSLPRNNMGKILKEEIKKMTTGGQIYIVDR